MLKIEKYQLRPLGWENDPEEERFKLSTLDYLPAMTYMNWALFFKLPDDPDKGSVNSYLPMYITPSTDTNPSFRGKNSKIISILKQGLERALSQARHLAGTIEKDPDNPHAHSFVKRRTSTVKFVVQHLDFPGSSFPSFADLEKANFAGTALGGLKNIDLLSNKPMTYGEKPEADPDNSPAVSSFKANFIPGGGLIFITHIHHYANDVSGWASFTQQLGENCAAIANDDGDHSSFPPWDPACLDRSRFTAPITTDEKALVDVPPLPDRHPDHRPSQSLIFHLPKSKAKALKAAATPPTSSPHITEADGGADGTDKISWISTYDALIALTWRTLTRLRAPLYNYPPEETVSRWGEGINLSKRLSNPSLPVRQQGNTFLPVLSDMLAAQIPPFKFSQILDDDTPLWKLATYIRQVTNTCGTQEYLSATLDMTSAVRNTKDLSVRVDSLPPMTVAVTDWRDAAGVTQTNFGGNLLGEPKAFRHLMGDVLSEGLVIVYPPRSRPRAGKDGNAIGEYEEEREQEDDEGIELVFAFEKELSDGLLGDETWRRYFEFRGVDGDPEI